MGCSLNVPFLRKGVVTKVLLTKALRENVTKDRLVAKENGESASLIIQDCMFEASGR